MSIRIALQAIGLLVVGYVLFWGFLAMGPPGWLFFGTLLAIATIQVYRSRRQSDSGEERAPYCANCGTELDLDLFGLDGPDRPEDPDTDHAGDRDCDTGWTVDYCPDCGAPVPSAVKRALVADGSPDGTRTADDSGPRNCADCGAPNDPHATACTYCGAEL